MSKIDSLLKYARAGSSRAFLIAALLVQAALLLPQPGLLPVWGDEQFTLTVTAQPLDRMLESLRRDYHPPLYFLIARWWRNLPFAGDPVAAIRLLSAIIALLATVIVWRLLLPRLGAAMRLWFLTLWVLSPLLLLYGRMGRSYTMQLALGIVAIYTGSDWVTQRRRSSGAIYVCVLALLLYTHYVPGLAIGAAVAVIACWRFFRYRDLPLYELVFVHAAAALLYLPWFATLWSTSARALSHEPPPVSGSPWIEHIVRTGYTFFAFCFGETQPLPVIAAAVVIGPLALFLLFDGAVQLKPAWLTVALVALIAGYVLVSKVVIFSLTPARLLWLFPFFLLLLVQAQARRPRLCRAVCTALMVVSLVGVASYWRKEGYLNKGYLLPLDSIARRAASELRGGGLLLLDATNTDARAIVEALPPDVALLTILDETAIGRLDEQDGDPVWLLRNTHDVTGTALATRIDQRLRTLYEPIAIERFVPYEPFDRLLMRALGWQERPDYVLELIRYRKRRGVTANVMYNAQIGR